MSALEDAIWCAAFAARVERRHAEHMARQPTTYRGADGAVIREEAAAWSGSEVAAEARAMADMAVLLAGAPT